ncbi:hypothetical protein TRVL_09983 [Trypanosoma vivax]|nr:hypothetical protein TRVL_09983 [Trypanosoma vivax]
MKQVSARASSASKLQSNINIIKALLQNVVSDVAQLSKRVISSFIGVWFCTRNVTTVEESLVMAENKLVKVKQVTEKERVVAVQAGEGVNSNVRESEDVKKRLEKQFNEVGIKMGSVSVGDCRIKFSHMINGSLTDTLGNVARLNAKVLRDTNDVLIRVNERNKIISEWLNDMNTAVSNADGSVMRTGKHELEAKAAPKAAIVDAVSRMLKDMCTFKTSLRSTQHHATLPKTRSSSIKRNALDQEAKAPAMWKGIVRAAELPLTVGRWFDMPGKRMEMLDD